MKKLFRIFICMIMLSAAFSCRKEEIEVGNDNDIFSTVYNGRSFIISYSLSRIVPADTVRFIFKNLKTNEVIDRSALVDHIEGEGLRFKLSEDVPDGSYLLAAVDYRRNPFKRTDMVRRGVGVGISFAGGKADLAKSRFDDDEEANDDFLEGEGTEEKPYLINCGDDLKKVQLKTNREPYETFEGRYFLQTIDIDLAPSSDFTYGWVPVSSYPNFPFKGCYDGGGNEITGLRILHKEANMYGLFGCAEGAVFQNINIVEPYIEAGSFVGSLVGSVFTAGDKVFTTTVHKINVKNPVVKGAGGVGAIVGSVDQYASLTLMDAKVDRSEISGQYGVGGALGLAAVHSIVLIDSLLHNGNISAVNDRTNDPVSLFGGIVGSCDTLVMTRTVNDHEEGYGSLDVLVTNSTGNDNVGIGIGGLVGGCGPSQFIACENRASVTTHAQSDGVGGLLGSSSAGKSSDGSEYYNTIIFLGTGNTGAVSGGEDVGGIMGEGQAIIMESYNAGKVRSGKNAGGIIAKAPSLIMHGVLNTAGVEGNTHVGGLVGYSPFNQIFLCNNYGDVSAVSGSANLGGIAGTAGNNSAISYSGNYGSLENLKSRSGGNGSLGGLVGLLGEQREYSAGDILSIVIGAVTVVGSAFDLGTGIGFCKEVLKAEGALPKVVFGVDIAINAVGLVSSLHFTHATYCHPYRVNSDEFGLGIQKAVDDVKFTRDELDKDAYDSFRNTVLDEGNVKKYPFSPQDIVRLADAQRLEYKAVCESCFTSGSARPDEKAQTAHDGLVMEKESVRDEVEEWKDGMTLGTTIVGWICTAAAIATLVAGAIVSGGAAVACLAVGVAAGVLGGSSGIVSGACNFTENTSMITQCYNFGDLNPSTQVYTGGLVGESGDFARIHNSYVVGVMEKRGDGHYYDHGGILGVDADRSEIDKCIVYSGKWPGGSVGTEYGGALVNNSLCVDGNADKFFDKSTYKELGLDDSYWTIDGNMDILPHFMNSKYLVK